MLTKASCKWPDPTLAQTIGFLIQNCGKLEITRNFQPAGQRMPDSKLNSWMQFSWRCLFLYE